MKITKQIKVFLSLFLSLILFGLSNAALAVNQNKIIYIYADTGTSFEALKHTISSLHSVLPKHYRIKKIYADEIKNTAWQKNAALFIMPGGADLPYVKALGGKGNNKIKAYVQNGGVYLGICAGAYYGCKSIAFALGSPVEVQGERELAFFPGAAQGPTLAAYDYKTNSGAKAALIKWDSLQGPFPLQKKFYVYYNGGCHFENAEQYGNVKIIASYDSMLKKRPAIIEVQVGKGKVILSGVHFEYNPKLLNQQDPYLAPIKKELLAHESDRKLLLKEILKRLNL